MSGPYAKIIADSTYEDGVRLSTMEVRFHRFVLAEFNTHRVFSRNSASSRAIPLKKQLAKVRDDTAYPLVFPKEQKGMQGGEALSDREEYVAGGIWREAAEEAADCAERLGELGVHKSVANRILEPFMWHTVVVTSTAWENFFRQRCTPMAQPEIRVAAEMMKAAYDESKPRVLQPDQWHLPYVNDDDTETVAGWAAKVHPRSAGEKDVDISEGYWVLLSEISAARCARTSYLTQDGIRDLNEDLLLYVRLTTANPVHWSPLEQVATPWPENRQEGTLSVPGRDWGQTYDVSLNHLPKTGNLLGWRSLRTVVEADKSQQTYS